VPPLILSSTAIWRTAFRGRGRGCKGTADLDHHRLRASYRTRHDAELIELGNEPPLSVDGEEGSLIDRRRISLQWFSGTILTGLCGAALMGGAVYASLDGETNFASLPERVEAALRGALGGGERTGARKADRLPAVAEPTVSRQIIRVSMTNRVGDRELVRVRPFVRVAGNLSLSVTELSANIPRFNPARLLAEAAPGGGAATEEVPGAAPDAEVSFVTRDLAAVLPRTKIALALSIEDVMSRVRDAANWTGPKPATYMVASVQPGMRLAYAAEGNLDPYIGFEARIVPENITLLPKTTSQTTGGNSWNEKAIVAKKGDSITTILRELGATADEAKAIAGVLGARGRDGGLKEGQRLRVLLAPAGKTQRLQPIRVIIAGENAVEAVVALSDVGKYVSVDVQSINTATEVADVAEEEDDGSGVRLYQSIYETALRNHVPRPVIDDLVRIYSYDVDFQRKVQPGDSFEVLFAGEDDTPVDGKNDVMFASLSVGGETKKFYRFQSPDDGVVDYYDETGKSAKKFLVRKPVADGVMRSGFGVRRHPILGYMKMHTGVDWSAPHGTPIYASGNGTVDKVGWESGYGKYVRLRHNNGYETAYGHMTAFARGIEPGVRVRQGQVIGFVGSTGLSTGSHLHYEILVNGRFVDPMRIRLPRGRVLDGPVLASFEKERERLDAMMTRAPARMAQTTASR
jgi:murein DD-endopeptidase MepM/ murein hydrolase activator NlpD